MEQGIIERRPGWGRWHLKRTKSEKTGTSGTRKKKGD